MKSILIAILGIFLTIVKILLFIPYYLYKQADVKLTHCIYYLRSIENEKNKQQEWIEERSCTRCGHDLTGEDIHDNHGRCPHCSFKEAGVYSSMSYQIKRYRMIRKNFKKVKEYDTTKQIIKGT